LMVMDLFYWGWKRWFVEIQSNVMGNQPKNMYHIRQILEHLSRGTSIKRITDLMGMSRNTVKDYRDKFLFVNSDSNCPALGRFILGSDKD
jgi:hypothetical protein